MLFAFRDDRVGRQIAIVVQQQMKFHRSLREAELGPIKHGGAEIDHRGVQARRRILRTDFLFFLVSGSLATNSVTSQQLFKHGAMQLRRPMLIGDAGVEREGAVGDPR